MKWPPLLEGTLIRRYQRFKADVKLRNHRLVTALCPNTGSMLSCSEPGRTVYLSRHNRPERRLKYTWEMIAMPTSLVGIDTGVPNRLVREALEQGEVPEMAGYGTVRAEVRYGTDSRIDLLLEEGRDRCWVEIKNCTLVKEGAALFPDAVTSRGLKHLVELQRQRASGDRAVMFYLVQRMDAEVFRPADSIDPTYARELRKALRNGVEALAYDVRIDRQGVALRRPLACDI